jgi:hypothetical protein
MIKVVIDFHPDSQERQANRDKWYRANMDQIRNDVARVDWRQASTEKTVEEAWDLFRDTISDTIERNVPKCGTGTR